MIEKAMKKSPPPLTGDKLPPQFGGDTSLEIRKTAIHESGHAVAFLRKGVAVQWVTIVPEESRNGYCAAIAAHFAQMPVEDQAVMMLAGPAAERRLGVAVSGDEDYHKLDIMFVMGLALDDLGLEDEAESDQWIADRTAETERFVTDRWPEIVLVASLLIEKKQLTGAEVSAALTKAFPHATQDDGS